MSTLDARFKLAWPGFTLDVDLRLPAHGVTAFFGQSGSGKTTLLRCLAGLERPPHGRLMVKGVVWQDENHWRPTHQRPIGYVFQEASLFPHLSVLGNLQYGQKRSGNAARFSLEQAIGLLGIGHLLPRKPEALSGGERQRVAIARALAVGPELLLMDEPLAALDLKRKQEILPYLERLHDELDIPVIYVSHAPDEVARLADHLVVLEAGRVTAQGPLQTVLANVETPIRLGEDAGAVLEGTLGDRDGQWHLARVDFPAGHLWVRDEGHPIGSTVRVRVLARDVSISLAQETSHNSILNHLEATVSAIVDDFHPALALVQLAIGDQKLIARVTRRSVNALSLTLGKTIWAQIKGVAVIG